MSIKTVGFTNRWFMKTKYNNRKDRMINTY